MKKKLYLFGATLCVSVLATSCSKQESSIRKNYYGVEPISNDTPKEAYYAFFCGILLVVILLSLGLRRLKNK